MRTLTASGVTGAHAQTAIELLVDELAQAESGLDRHGFYSRLAEVVCRIGEMERAVIFRFDGATHSVEAAGSHGVDLARFSGVSVSLETAPDAALALSEDRVIEALPPKGDSVVPALKDLLPALNELVAGRPLVYVPMAAAGRWPGVIVAQPWAGAPPIDEARQELLWTLGKTLALASMARIATFEGERARELEARIDLAREVHERVVQRLFGASMALSPPGDLSDADRRRCVVEVEAALTELRSAIQRPLRRDARRRGGTLAEDLARMSSLGPGPAVRVEGTIPPLAPALEPLVQSVLAEAVRNVGKHSSAQSLTVRFRRHDGAVVMEVENEGLPLNRASGPPGVGLRIAALEALHVGGLLEFGERSPGRWQVRLAVPADVR